MRERERSSWVAHPGQVGRRVLLRVPGTPTLRRGRSRCCLVALLFGALLVEAEEAHQDFVAEVVGPAVAPGLFAAAGAATGVGLVVVHFVVVEQELVRRMQVGPLLGVEDGAVHRSVQFAHLLVPGEASSGSWKRL